MLMQRQKKRVKDNVYPEFLKKYNSAGPECPNLSSLLTVSSFRTSHNVPKMLNKSTENGTFFSPIRGNEKGWPRPYVVKSNAR